MSLLLFYKISFYLLLCVSQLEVSADRKILRHERLKSFTFQKKHFSDAIVVVTILSSSHHVTLRQIELDFDLNKFAHMVF